ncbi:mycofactocin biosynthesis glycosyltransferase MftF [Haloechinothrix salitolerans]|uniref:Mycofactocin biosynthesis glycosyltransferase MftF n=1 Tax=Haloechinothrix salitolerans TaxID=926830 RepID=A0ABW2BXF8_9PSEU
MTTAHHATDPDSALAGCRVVPDTTLRRHAHSRVVLGGSPTRLLRLTTRGAALLDRWCAGEPIGTDPHETALARRLLDTGLLHPVPRPGRYTSADVTVVVPVKDNPDGVARLRAATGDLATIVVDDGSTAPFLGATVRHRTPAGPAAARNTGWQHATTDLVAFLDADTLPEPGWLDRTLGLFDDPDVAAVAPRVRGLPGASPIARYEADHSALDLGPHPATVRPMSRVSYVPTAALIIRRTALAAFGGFDERLRYGEDVDLIWRLIAAGHTIRYQPEATVWHQPRPTLRAWLRQRHDYGTSAAPLATRHPGLLACARASRWTLAGAALTAAGRPGLGLTIAAASTAALPRTLRRKGVSARAALTLTGQGQLSAATILAAAVRRGWWPLLLPTKRGRRILAASLLPCLTETVTHHKGPRWLALRIADDLAYSTGVIAGCARHRTMAPLLPQSTERHQP